MDSKKEQTSGPVIDVTNELNKFIVAMVRDPETKKSPEMVVAIARLYEVIIDL